MTSNEKPVLFSPTIKTALLFLAVTAAVVLALYMIVRSNALNNTYKLAQETESFLETTCAKYENYENGNTAESMQNLLDDADGLRSYISKEKLEDDEFLFAFAQKEHLGGIVLVDSAGNRIAGADLNQTDPYLLWKDILTSPEAQSILAHPSKTYSDAKTLNEHNYNFVIVSCEKGLLLCYKSLDKPSADRYGFNFADILTNDSFRQNPTAVIVKNDQLVSTNNPSVNDAINNREGPFAANAEWSSGSLTHFDFDGNSCYGLHCTYEDYEITLLYPISEILDDTVWPILIGVMVYLGICASIAIVRGYSYKKNLNTAQKQLRIIRAISATYQSTFLLHLDRMELEPIQLSEEVAAINERHPEPHDFLKQVCLDVIAPEYRKAVHEFMELETISERLQGKSFIACEIKDLKGVWHSLQMIPQRYDDKGAPQAILVATRNITTLKQAEKLSYFDKLTGLHNRNYMESHIIEFEDETNRPLSIIMADCNFLKSANDTLGHVWGDTLLQRTADSLRSAAPEDATIMRIGGDEFLIACPGTTPKEALSLIEAAKEQLASRSDETLTLSVAFGSFTLNAGSTISFNEACQNADTAMYAEKKRTHRQRRTD